QKVMGVVDRVFEHPFRQWTPAPVGLLRSLGQFDSEVALDERSQTEFAKTEKARRHDGVENPACGKIQTAAEQSQIEIGPVQHDLLVAERSTERCKIDTSQRIEDVIAVRQTDLKQAKFFPIGMKTVGFGVDRDALDPGNVFDQLGQLRGVCNHRSPLRSNSA